MPAQAVMDEPGTVYHSIARGIECDNIFCDDDQDRDACVAVRKSERIPAGEA